MLARVLLVPVVALAACFSPQGGGATTGGSDTSMTGGSTTGGGVASDTATGAMTTMVGTASTGTTASAPTTSGVMTDPSTSVGPTATATSEPSSSTRPSDDPVCGNDILETGEECDDGNLVDTDGCTSACVLGKCGDGIIEEGVEECDGGPDCDVGCRRTFLRVFLTSDPVFGDFKGLGGADALCNSLAAAAGQAGNYKAWLSAGNDSPATRFVPSTRPWRLVNGVTVAHNWGDLIDGTLEAPINLSEKNMLIGMDAVCGQCPVWTATTTLGTPIGGTCSNWSMGGLMTAKVGECGAADGFWTQGCPEAQCATDARLYCFEQSLPP